ncbi:MAG: hypothetical protein QOC57_1860, partial [Ilumatobacteraceae bacterium]
MNVSDGNAASETFVSCMHKMSGCMSLSHSSIRGKRTFSELTFHVAMRTGSTVANQADLARRRVGLAGSGDCTGAAAANAGAFLAARLRAVGAGVVGVGAAGAGAGAAFFDRALRSVGGEGAGAGADAGADGGAFFDGRFFGAAGAGSTTSIGTVLTAGLAAA